MYKFCFWCLTFLRENTYSLTMDDLHQMIKGKIIKVSELETLAIRSILLNIKTTS